MVTVKVVMVAWKYWTKLMMIMVVIQVDALEYFSV
jgi:hypothetical protein